MRYRGVGWQVTYAYVEWVERIRKRTAEGKQPRLYEMRFMLAEYDRLSAIAAGDCHGQPSKGEEPARA